MSSPTKCQQCGAPITQSGHGPPRSFCGISCYRKHHRNTPAGKRKRHAEQARRRKRRQDAREMTDAVLPSAHSNTTLAFWKDELKRDLEQERQLAILERRVSPQAAVDAYRRREVTFHYLTVTFLLDGDNDDD